MHLLRSASLYVLVASLGLVAACTKTQAKSAIDVAAEACTGILDLTVAAPAAPLCMLADEVAKAIADLATKAAKTGAGAAAPAGGFPWSEIRAQVLQNRAAAAPKP